MINRGTINSIFERLRAELGDASVTRDGDILAAYSRDETSDLAAAPDILVRARSATDVAAVMRACNERRVPVVPRGAGTGVTGGAVATAGGVVLSLERMNRIIEIDAKNMIAVVEPGAITGEIQRSAAAAGLMYPPDPASLDSCSIGGNIAEGAGGPRAVKYGTTKDYVTGLEFVTPEGHIITAGGKYVKNATGYNLVGAIIGSEGTLVVVTKIFLKLLPAPRASLDLLVPFDSLDSAVDTVTAILHSGVLPAAIEFMEADAIDLVATFLHTAMPFPDARAHLLIQLDGASTAEVEHATETIARVLPVPAERVIAAQDPAQRERIWKARRSIREAIHAESPVFLAEDSVVPRNEIPAFLADVKAELQRRALRSVMFGHAGDGNVHIDVLKGAMDDAQWGALVPELKGMIYRAAIARGGTITGEHGTGFTRKRYLGLAYSAEAIELMRRIKTAFDPNGILNPGKIIDG
ncbi:MAG TPA: FAD-linked oxidase C-terminal domain-containing protein [Spirochaetota bacterium]|nr:FAD-linked oxidase C-terminal domain-containing protein [Spirochaetota bacterium]HPI23021.1 FAD-linked oxidase C-terminal domain-containing protein [Spirochaetota bacterium]HPU88139.1 FAD-linked oxidase C-terminal domain-containing protein [Spirochaetota bacterium]